MLERVPATKKILGLLRHVSAINTNSNSNSSMGCVLPASSLPKQERLIAEGDRARIGSGVPTLLTVSIFEARLCQPLQMSLV